MDLKQMLPMPKLEECKSLLCIQPHPDDNEVGAGGTIAKLVRQGCHITYLTVTDGSKGTDDPHLRGARLAEVRRQEAIEAAGVLGVATHHWLGLPDGGYPDEEALTRSIAAVIQEVRPELVMTVDPYLPYEGHVDHRRVGLAATEAVMFNPLDLPDARPDDPTWQPWRVSGIVYQSTAWPNTFINVDDTWDLRNKAILTHRSQFDEASFALLGAYFDVKARQYARGIGCERAEAFKVLPPVLLHMCVDTMNL
jgi:LmbE family N-acetylglucosaminyl deacetylase